LTCDKIRLADKFKFFHSFKVFGKIRKFLEYFEVFVKLFLKKFLLGFWLLDFCGVFGEFLHRVFGSFLP
jgi:hypothetical protein